MTMQHPAPDDDSAGTPGAAGSEHPPSTDDVARSRRRRRPAHSRVEVYEALLLALAALLIAWAGFQSTKWGGVQANNFNLAGATRTESVRASNLANRQTVIDVTTYTAWVNAVANELRDDVDNGFDPDSGSYEPAAGTQSSFLYERFRPEFRTAFDAWVATRPLADPNAPPTPFDLPEYRLAADQTSKELESRAEASSAIARAANQRGDNYVMMTILFALALVLVGVGSKMQSLRIRAWLTAGSAVALALGIAVLLTYPIEI